MNPTPILDGLLTRRQLADMLDVCTKTIERHEARGLPFIRVGQMRLCSVESVRAWLLGRETTKQAA